MCWLSIEVDTSNSLYMPPTTSFCLAGAAARRAARAAARRNALAAAAAGLDSLKQRVLMALGRLLGYR
jgi:hypothetical protein